MERMTVSNADEFKAALSLSLKSGDQLVYHIGFLMSDRLPCVNQRKRLIAERVDRLAHAAYRAYKDKVVCLVQRRLGFGVYEYVAVKR